MSSRSLILVTNDDGIHSRGLWATVEAVLPLGKVLVVAPDRQWSGAGRAVPGNVTGQLRPIQPSVGNNSVAAYAVDASPAQAVIHGVLELAPHRPALVVSGINLGTNLGLDVTLSGTVGAALEAAAFGIPAMAVSLEVDAAYHHHHTGDPQTDFRAAIAFTRRLARYMLNHILPHDADVLNVNIPAGATPQTGWQFTRLARRRFFMPLAPNRAQGHGRPGYRQNEHFGGLEFDSDIWTICLERKISVTPLSLDLTASVALEWIKALPQIDEPVYPETVVASPLLSRTPAV